MSIAGLETPVRHRLRFAQTLDLGASGEPCLHIVRADGRGPQLRIPAGWTSVWMVLAGTPEADAGWSTWRLEPGQMLAWTDGALTMTARGSCWWLAVVAPTSAWSQRHGAARGGPGTQLMPWQAKCPGELRRILVRMARDNRVAGNPAGDLFGLLPDLLREQQRSCVQSWLSRSSGRTLQRKQQSLLRLLRVRRIVRSQPEARLDLASLAGYANYSPHHLIRVYRNVFGETPAEYALRLRTRRAWRLVRDTRLPICEITEMLGFESQSAFCRSFKQSFGMTTGQARRLVVAQPVRIDDAPGIGRERAIAA